LAKAKHIKKKKKPKEQKSKKDNIRSKTKKLNGGPTNKQPHKTTLLKGRVGPKKKKQTRGKGTSASVSTNKQKKYYTTTH
jgi:hypothetical protein